MLKFDVVTFFGFVVNFLILYVLFRMFFYKPFKKVIDQREKEIQDATDQNNKLRIESQEKNIQMQNQLLEAEKQAKKIITDSTDMAQEIYQKAKKESKQQAKEMILGAEEEIKTSLETSNQVLKKRALGMAGTISHGIISSIMTYSMDCDLVRKLIVDLPKADVTEASGATVSFQMSLKNAIQKKESVKVITAIELPWDIREEMTKTLHSIAGQTIDLIFEKTQEISGGFILNFGFTSLDFSIESQISSIVSQLE
jgi:F-type H+-transporting ATPase subunit b